MTIAILCTNREHPVIADLQQWRIDTAARGHDVSLHFDKTELTAGDLLLLVSCGQLIGPAERAKFRHVLVLHASDLPQDRGWSPHIWAIIGGAHRITLSLMEAVDPVDTGDVWLKTTFDLEGHELLPEINDRLFAAELALMTQAVENFNAIQPWPQTGDPGPSLRKRTPADSQLDPEKTLGEQFDLLRVVDNERYPAFMDYRGKRYVIRIDKAIKQEAP